MRKFIIPLLLASVAASPAMAQDSDREERRARAAEEREERRQAREEREQEPREERQQQPREQAPQQAPQQVQIEQSRPDRGDRQERARQRGGDNPAVVQQPAGQERQRGERPDRQRPDRQQQIEQQVERQRYDRRADQATGQVIGQPRRDARQRVDARRQQWDQQRTERIARQERIRNSRPPVISPTPRPGTQPPPPPPSARPVTNPPVRWSGNHWRNDRRYDWNRHRNKYWWLFQLGWYNDPFGWGYQPYGIGWRMWPSYYSRHYWLDDPWQYRLPYAPAGTRWIRYWDDAVLVDLWSGQVVDVVYNFFW